MALASAGRCALAERIPHARHAVFPAERRPAPVVTPCRTAAAPRVASLRCCRRCACLRC